MKYTTCLLSILFIYLLFLFNAAIILSYSIMFMFIYGLRYIFSILKRTDGRKIN